MAIGVPVAADGVGLKPFDCSAATGLPNPFPFVSLTLVHELDLIWFKSLTPLDQLTLLVTLRKELERRES